MATGLIPARAGNTVPAVARPPARGAHPRSRGEHTTRRAISSGDPGSSPLARGTPPLRAPKHIATGLIPARAGNTDVPDIVERAYRAHPRSRGEHAGFNIIRTTSTGSSPLARGTHIFPKGKPKCPGLIPARAGNTFGSKIATARKGAHPRSRGEHRMGNRRLKD